MRRAGKNKLSQAELSHPAHTVQQSRIQQCDFAGLEFDRAPDRIVQLLGTKSLRRFIQTVAQIAEPICAQRIDLACQRRHRIAQCASDRRLRQGQAAASASSTGVRARTTAFRKRSPMAAASAVERP